MLTNNQQVFAVRLARSLRENTREVVSFVVPGPHDMRVGRRSQGYGVWCKTCDWQADRDTLQALVVALTAHVEEGPTGSGEW